MKDPYPHQLFTLFVFLAFLGACSPRVQTDTISSPSGQIRAAVYADGNKRLTYTVQYNGKPLVEVSPLGITINGKDLGQGVEVGNPAFALTDQQYPWTGVHSKAINHYREIFIPVTNKATGIRYQLQVKAFDDGLAYRYVVPAKGISVVGGEASSWRIPEGSTVWYQENIFYYEGLYYASPISGLGSKKIGPPLTYQTRDGLYGCITEAALYDYSGMSLQSDSGGLLRAAFVNDPEGWKIRDTVTTPWRVLIAGSSLNTLVNSDIIPDLNPAPQSHLQNAKWIRPGRAVWSYFMHDNVTTVALEKTYVDKAEQLGFEYSMVDAGWEWTWPSAMDSLKALATYARQKQVGIWVWKSYASLKEDSVRRNFFKQLHDAGVAGVKIDFIDTEGIKQIRFYENALKDAAAEQLMIDFHGADKPTGYNRTYPNELTREAIYGQEWRTYNPQGPANNATIPFTRFLAGPGDYTPGVFNSKKAYGTSRVQQLALPIIFNSPLICWPSDPDVYLSSPALPIIKAIPTIWDETIVLPPSRIGELAAFARRKGQDWFIGIINAGNEKQLTIPLKFLGKGQFKADIARDDLTDPDHLLYSQTAYTASDSLSFTMRPAGGYVAMLRKTGEGTAPALSISPGGGYIYAPTPVRMNSSKGLAIRYTTDGREPSAADSLYTKPLTIKKPVLIRARAFNQNGQPVEASGVARFLDAPAPVPSVPAGIFIDTQKVGLAGSGRQGTIHYTLDGSDPTLGSPLYKDSLLLTKTTMVKAREFFTTGVASATTIAGFHLAVPSPAITDRGVKPGLKADYYEGEWKMMPDFKKIPVKKSIVVSSPDLEQLQARKDFYAARFSGFIRIPATGVYTFFINSDDGSQFYLDGEQLVDNDGCHGDLEKSGSKALAAGLHRVVINYFQNGSGQTLEVYMKGSAIKKQIIPASLLFYQQ